MTKKIIATDLAPAAIGPYSQAISAQGLIFCSGQIALDPATGKLVEGGIAEQAEQALQNVKALLTAAGSSLEMVVKTTVFIKNMADFTEVNTIYARYFTQECPARSCVEVAALPKGALIEIEVIAC